MKIKETVASHFTATHIAYMSLFTALAFVVTFLEFPIFPAAPYLKLDFANVFFMIEGFIFGPVEAIFSILVKELLCFAKSSSGGVGELANFLMSVAYILVPSVVYRFKKGRAWVALYLLCACLLQIAVSLPANRYLTFPFYMGDGAADAFRGAWLFVLAFNAIKSVLISLIVLLIYKPLSSLIKATQARVNKKRERRARKKDAQAAEQAEPLSEEQVKAQAAGEQGKTTP